MDLNTQDTITKLRDKGTPIYSISRLNSVDNCGYEYWLTYHEHLQTKDNIYGITGGEVHKCLEEMQKGIKVDFPARISKMLEEARFLDIAFPNENIEKKWERNILAFANNYKKPEYNKVETEKLFLIELNGKYLQGIIDLVIYNEDDTVSIIDYKTSSKFAKADLEEKGRQLILYGLAMEKMGYKVKDLAWHMLKYAEISYKLKNGKTKTTIAEYGYVLDKLKVDITRELKAMKKYTELEIEEMVDIAVENNSFDNLPKQIKEKYTIKDYILPYDFSEKNKKDTIDFIRCKIEDIELFAEKEDWWEPKDINAGTKFYCENLCGQRDRCPYLEDYHRIMEQYQDIDTDKELSKFTDIF